MLIADFTNTQTDTIIISGLFQWDYGQQLEIRGLNLPEIVQIHFSTNKDCGNALRMVGSTLDGVTTVKIPDVMLEEQEFCCDTYTIWAFVYVSDESSGETVKRVAIKTKSRPKPEDYTEPDHENPFEDTIEQVKQYADQAEQSAADAETARTGAEKAYQDTIEAVDQIKEDQISMAEKIAIKPTATGTDIVAEDSADWRLLDLSVNGWTEQTVTDGKQLYDIDLSKKEESYKKIEFESFSGYFIEYQAEPLTNYCISCSSKSSSITAALNISNGSEKLSLSSSGIYSRTITTLEDGKLYVGFVGGTLQDNVPVFSEQYFNIMLNKGSEALLWEPYTGGQPSPSPEYQQDIVNTGKYNEETEKYEVEVKFTGKNLIKVKEDLNMLINGVTVKSNEKEQIVINGTSSLGGGRENMLADIVKLKKGSYVFSVNSVKSSTNIPYFYLNDKEINVVFSTNSEQKKKLEIDSDVFFGVGFNSDTSYDGIYEVQLEIGEEKTDYETARVPETLTITSDRPLTKWDRLEKREGKWGWVYKSAETEFDGSEDEDWSVYIDKGFRVTIDNMKNQTRGDGYCDKLINDKKGTYIHNSFWLGVSNNTFYIIYPQMVGSDLAEWKTWLQSNPLKVLYETEAEEWVELPQEEQNALNALTTYCPTTVIQNDAGMEMTVKYVADPENYLKKNYQKKLDQIDTLAGQVATLQEYIIKEV